MACWVTLHTLSLLKVPLPLAALYWGAQNCLHTVLKSSEASCCVKWYSKDKGSEASVGFSFPYANTCYFGGADK